MTAHGLTPRGSQSGRRGQLTVDFVVGVAVFVVAVAVVVGVVPQLFEPYDDAEATVVVDRVADDLADDLLAAGGGSPPGALNDDCTIAFFEGSGGSGCPFDPTASLSDTLGVDSTFRINVTLEWKEPDSERTVLLCHDDSTVQSCTSMLTPLAAGPDVPGDRRSVASATRVVRVSDRTALLKIRVWSS